MVLLFSPSIYRFPGCLYCISKNLRTARRLLGEYIPIGDEPKRNDGVEKLPQIPFSLVERISKLLILHLPQTARGHSKDFFNTLKWFWHSGTKRNLLRHG